LSVARRAWSNFSTFFKRHKNTYDTAVAFRRLRNNLAEEQKALAELDYLVYMKLLDPLQLAKCVLATYPKHCDVVSLLNAVGSDGSDSALVA
jgi:hypothetical protein